MRYFKLIHRAKNRVGSPSVKKFRKTTGNKWDISRVMVGKIGGRVKIDKI